MGFFGRRDSKHRFDPDNEKAVIVQSICTGEKSLCFVDKATGIRHQVGCIRDDADLDAYVKEYHLSKGQIEREF